MNKLIYLDYAATTPVLPEVIEKVVQCLAFDGHFGNPASQSHHYGWDAEKLVANARQEIANLIHADASEIIWTSGATESNNLALKGIATQYPQQKKHIITSQIEHKAILDTCAALELQGFEVTYLQPQADTGLITPEQVAAAIQPNTVLISLMFVNNEIGTVTDIAAIGALAKQHQIVFHVDAAQAAGKIKIDVDACHIDLLSLSGHKVYGPKGIGALYVRQAVQPKLCTQIHGGGHERGLRSGTLATHQIVGMGAAFALAQQKLETEQQRLAELRLALWQALQQLDDVVLNGHPQQRVENYLSVSFVGEHANSLTEKIKQLAAVSSSSACNSKNAAPSHVLLALGRSAEAASHSIRFSFGAYTTLADIQFLVAQLKVHLTQPKVNFFVFN
ncbi:cysteine desulfurase family protein [Acinetobacter sp. MD2(2019)]|uniref:cysteine desulfurase family protein n=1 Tax=Acinetobacter sp. MD2(2019) TaxID=2605273 RepID=UPI002D1F1B57|nr:aminotransferase class V-fold PLP-dependent enzyme [Acinetobacter sp. MD2(2019)]MEB3752739.1 aminotransferase class V-fold PLP-dependent enzyme [Acinetobacter sp. MD2(2019)]